jgi:glucokinase
VILAGDIGGTSARLAFFTLSSSPSGVGAARDEKTAASRIGQIAAGLRKGKEQDFASRDFPSLDAIVSQFIAGNADPVEMACFGIPGPVREGRAITPNLPWVVDAASLAKMLDIKSVLLINDLEANTYGIGALNLEDLVVLNAGADNAEGNLGVISAGTGLGEAGAYWDGMTHRPFPCEGGHADFSPRTHLECEFLTYLLNRHDHVSYERVLSGSGLLNIYRFLRDSRRGEEPAWLTEEMNQQDPAAVISKAALEGRSPLCEHALEMFVQFYGAEAGNLALKVMATGGLFIGGGIAPKIINKLKAGSFVLSFTNKGRMRPLLESIPVRVILNDRTALMGAARAAVLKNVWSLQWTISGINAGL